MACKIQYLWYNPSLTKNWGAHAIFGHWTPCRYWDSLIYKASRKVDIMYYKRNEPVSRHFSFLRPHFTAGIILTLHYYARKPHQLSR